MPYATPQLAATGFTGKNPRVLIAGLLGTAYAGTWVPVTGRARRP